MRTGSNSKPNYIFVVFDYLPTEILEDKTDRYNCLKHCECDIIAKFAEILVVYSIENKKKVTHLLATCAKI